MREDIADELLDKVQEVAQPIAPDAALAVSAAWKHAVDSMLAAFDQLTAADLKKLGAKGEALTEARARIHD